MKPRWRVAAVPAVLAVAAACSIPPVDLEAARPLALRSSIRAADGKLLARLYRENRALVPMQRIPEVLKNAVLAAEDARFYEHPGYDLKAIARAAAMNLREGDVVQGGSTITQQYVKNAYFDQPEKTLERKARELRLAMEVERRYSKDEILERYLNTVYLGDGAYGVRAAAETYFDTGVEDLELHHSALLAAVIKAPSFYEPRSHPKRAKRRRDYVLDRMAELGRITSSQAEEAKARRLGVTPRPPRLSLRQPYFVEAVKREILSDKRFGASGRARARALYRGGLEVETTIDLDLQRAAEGAVRSVLDHPGDPAAALVAIRPKTGEIVAMVGGDDWSTSQVNLALGKLGGGSGRQPGSSFKPIVVATALEAGIPLEARYQSSSGVFPMSHGEPWIVRNSSEGGGSGMLSVSEALVHSVNGVFARLALQIGPSQIATQASLMGVGANLPSYPSISLGASEVSVLDMAAAYATLANGGTALEPTTIRGVRTPVGTVIVPEQEVVESAVSPGNAYLITKTLEQVIRRGTGRAANIGRPAAGKTGTTNDYADAWFVGYTPQLVTAVWVGYPQGRLPMTSVRGTRVLGGTFPAQIWREFMLEAHRGLPVGAFRFPRSELITVKIDPATGLLAAPWCEGRKQRMLRQLAPTEYCPVPRTEPIAPQLEITPEPSPEAARKGPGKKSGPEASPSSSPPPSPAAKQSPSPSPTA